MTAVPMRPAQPVVLVGLMGSGKSTVGRLLARRWEIPFIDLDQLIEQRAGMSIVELFAREGEMGFRRREAEATRAVTLEEPVVVAVGGGWMVRPELRDSWKDAARVWLQVTPGEAADRLAACEPSRPLLADGQPEKVLQDLLEQRLPSYRLSEYTVDTSGRTAREVARCIAELLERPGGEVPGMESASEFSTES